MHIANSIIFLFHKNNYYLLLKKGVYGSKYKAFDMFIIILISAEYQLNERFKSIPNITSNNTYQ